MNATTRMKKLLAFLTVTTALCAPTIAHAETVPFAGLEKEYLPGGYRSSGITPDVQWANYHVPGGIALGATSFCQQYAIDNQCAGAQNPTYVDYTGATHNFTPSWGDINFAFNSAQSGQCNSTPTCATYNANLHLPGANYAVADYNIGSAPVGILRAGYLLAQGIGHSGPGDNTNCTMYSALSGPHSSSPTKYIDCAYTTTGQGSTINVGGYDMSNNGSGTGTDYIALFIDTSVVGTQHVITVVNNYWKCASVECLGVIGGNNPVFTYQRNGNGDSPASILFSFNTFDGNWYSNPGWSPPTVPTVTYAEWILIADSNSISPAANVTQWTISYNYTQDQGDLGVQNKGTVIGASNYNFYGNGFNRACEGGIGGQGCHWEIFEDNAFGRQKIVNYKGNVTAIPSMPQLIDITSNIWMAAGNYSGNIVQAGEADYNLIIANTTACTNTPASTPPFYTPTGTQCGVTSGAGGTDGVMFTSTKTAMIRALTLIGNVADVSGSNDGCYSNPVGPASNVGFGKGTTTTVTGGAGGFLTLAGPNWTSGMTMSALNAQNGIFTGETLRDKVGGHSFVDTEIIPYEDASGGTANPWAEFNATISGGTLLTINSGAIALNEPTSFTASIGSTFTGTGSGGTGATLTVTGITGYLSVGDTIAGTGITGAVTIASQTSGTTGSNGTYTVTLASGATFAPSAASITATSNIMNVTGSVTNPVVVPMSLTGSGLTATTITGQNSGTSQGAGLYSIGTKQIVGVGASFTVSGAGLGIFATTQIPGITNAAYFTGSAVATIVSDNCGGTLPCASYNITTATNQTANFTSLGNSPNSVAGLNLSVGTYKLANQSEPSIGAEDGLAGWSTYTTILNLTQSGNIILKNGQSPYTLLFTHLQDGNSGAGSCL